MRRILSGVSGAVSTLFVSAAVFAQTPTPGFAGDGVLDAKIRTPGNRIISPDTPIGQIVSFVVAFIIVVAFLAALLFVVIGALQWITSGGDKQRVADARNHIIAAIIGLIVIALSFVIINIIITALGLGSLTNLQIPTLQEFR